MEGHKKRYHYLRGNFLPIDPDRRVAASFHRCVFQPIESVESYRRTLCISYLETNIMGVEEYGKTVVLKHEAVSGLVQESPARSQLMSRRVRLSKCSECRAFTYPPDHRASNRDHGER